MATKNVKPDELEDAVMADLLALARGTADEAQQRIIQKTPILSGAARASIKVSINGETVEYDKDNTNWTGTMTANSELIKNAKIGDTINIIMGAPYGAKLENGSSEQAPNGMFATTGEDTDAIVALVSEKLSSYS